jgi:hypothetical protein
VLAAAAADGDKLCCAFHAHGFDLVLSALQVNLESPNLAPGHLLDVALIADLHSLPEIDPEQLPCRPGSLDNTAFEISSGVSSQPKSASL